MSRENATMDIQYSICQAYNGRKKWLDLKDKHSINSSVCVVLLESNDKTVFNIVVRNSQEYLKKKYLKKMLIIFSETNTSVKEIAVKNIFYEKVTISDFMSLIMYQKATPFFDNLIVVSLSEPFCTPYLIGEYGIDIEEYIKGTFFE